MKIRKLLYVILIISTIGYTSCSNEDDTLMLIVDTPYVELQPGNNTIVSITSGNGDYSVRSDDENIAVAIIEGNRITITAKKQGQLLL